MEKIKKPTKEQIAAFWEWCGIPKREVYENLDWFFSSIEITLNNLFKYAIPPIAKEYRMKFLMVEHFVINVIISQGEKDMKNLVIANEELNNWCGTKDIKYYESLDACFKYAVPKLYEQDYYYELLQWNNAQHKAIINKKTVEWAVTASDAIEESPALALFWAIYEVMHYED